MRDDPEMDHEAFMAQRAAKKQGGTHRAFHHRAQGQGDTEAHGRRLSDQERDSLADWNADPIS